MAFLSNHTRGRIGEASIAGLLIFACFILQLAVLSKMPFGNVLCNLPLAFTIVWGVTFGSPLPRPTADELRMSNLGSIFVRQLLSGSPSGAIVGAIFAALFSCILPVFPVCYPVVGWACGYFSLKNFNQAAFLIIPLVILFTIWSEGIMALQLYAMGRPNVLAHLVTLILPAALLNALIAPVLFIPMRGWLEFRRWRLMDAS
ncbi:MAG: hypothetical protein J0H83_01375 [Candidatus Melainabacteria bacterium]|jgi:rod shape-determining protein MreD|nr:hypothetical protein [Candidatus Melainabacteria bacterium]